jgi:hypothetical protein
MHRFTHPARIQRQGLVPWYGETILQLADRQRKWFHHAKPFNSHFEKDAMLLIV